MNKSAKNIREQLNLHLLDAAVGTAIPADKQKELNRALMELLLDLAQEDFRMPSEGGEHDELPQAHA
jgi:hypothetical protein